MGRKPKRRPKRHLKGKRPSASDRAKPIMDTIRSQLAALAPIRRKRTILLMEGINQLTGRPIRVYIAPNDVLTCVETIAEGQLERERA